MVGSGATCGAKVSIAGEPCSLNTTPWGRQTEARKEFLEHEHLLVAAFAATGVERQRDGNYKTNCSQMRLGPARQKCRLWSSAWSVEDQPIIRRELHAISRRVEKEHHAEYLGV